jgi:hypothetical protein
MDSRLGQAIQGTGVPVAGNQVWFVSLVSGASGQNKHQASLGDHYSAPSTPTSRSDQGLPASVHRRPSAPSKPRPQVIIVSEPSADAGRRDRTGRSIPVRSRSSATHNDTPRHLDALPIRVHTEVLAGS